MDRFYYLKVEVKGERKLRMMFERGKEDRK